MPESTRRLGFQPRLNGIRGLAILTVVVYHELAGPHLPGGFLGVDLFFVLSGFLITTLLVNEHDSTNAVSLRAFYLRRALRLFPALGVMIIFCLAVTVTLHGHDRHSMLLFVVASTFYVANLFVASGHPIYYSFTWSLAAEEQFYLAWPATLILLLRRRLSTTGLVAFPLAGIVASTALALALTRRGGHAPLVFFFPLTHAQPILVGCVLGILYARDKLPRGHARHAVQAAGVVGLGVYLVLVLRLAELHIWTVRWGFLVTGLAVAPLLAAAVDAQPWFVFRIFDLRPVRYIGRISYAMYLWNSIVFDRLPDSVPRWTGILVTVAIAAVSMELVEKRFLAKKPKRVEPRASIAPATSSAAA